MMTTFERDLLVAVAILVVALLILHAMEYDAEAQGTCTAYYVKVYNAACNCYTTKKVWRCTSWQRPRRSYYPGYNYWGYRRYY